MPEAAIIILDNSTYSINGDYFPTRWISQVEAAGLLIQAKMDQNQQTAMGLALSAGKQVEIICTPTTDHTKVNSFLYGIKTYGLQKLSIVLQTAALALKHRANPALPQRIICFIASTITEGIEELRIICKKLKKNKICLDLIGIGDLSEQQRQKMQIMHDSVKNQIDICQLIFVEPQSNLSDALFNSRILGAQQNVPPAMNESDDPQLRMALALSLQEQQIRLAAAIAVTNQAQPQQPPRQNEEEDLQQRALNLSLDESKKDQKKEDKKQQ